VGVAAATFVVYAAGACPTIFVGDSGELVAAVHVLGIPHPTGYPLYVLLGKAWTLLVPIGSVAYRMSLFSAACTAVACALVYDIGRRAGWHPIAALASATLFAFGASVWGEANVQRVYALGAVFVAGATALLWSWHRTGRDCLLVWAALVCGLGATNHMFMAVYGAVASVFVIVHAPRVLRRGRLLAACLGAGLAGLLPYLYLPLRSAADPALDWGDPESGQALFEVVMRRDFWERAWIEAPGDVLTVAADFVRTLGPELTWGGVGLAALGLAAGVRRGAPVLLLAGVVIANVFSLALHGSRSDIFIWHRYYVPAYMSLALAAGLGTQMLVTALPRALRVAPLALPAVLLATGWQSFDRSRYEIGEAFSQAVLRTLPPGAHLIATDDNILFILIYLRLVEGVRPDVNLIMQGVGDADLPPLRFDPDRDPLFFTHHPNWNVPGLAIDPVGLLFQARRLDAPPAALHLPDGPLPGEADPRVPKDYLTQNLIGHFHYMQGVTLETRDWLRARAAFARAMRAAAHNDVLFYNVGLIFRRNGLLGDAQRAFERSHALNPRHIASKSQVRAADRLAEVRAEATRIAGVRARLASAPELDGLGPATPAYLARLAVLLEAAGEPAAARGAQLEAMQAASVDALAPSS
jgi:hypothetical protein